MDIKRQDRDVALAVILFLSAGMTGGVLMGHSIYIMFLLIIFAGVFGAINYKFRRNQLFLQRLIKIYRKSKNTTTELDEALIYASYGRYNNAAKPLDRALKNNPNDKELKYIVTCIDGILKK